MPSKDLFLLAAECYAAKPWRYIDGDEVFAVSLPDGEIGYVALMKAPPILSLYAGIHELVTAREIFELIDEGSEGAVSEAIMREACLRCAYTGKSELHPRETRQFEECGLQFSSGAYPIIRRKRPYFYGWSIEDEADEARMELAFRATMEAARKVIEGYDSSAGTQKTFCLIRKHELGFNRDGVFADRMPLLTPNEDGSFAWSVHDVPAYRACEARQMDLDDETLLARLRRAKRAGKWECSVFMSLEPIILTDDEEETFSIEKVESAPYYPLALIIVDHETGETLQYGEADDPEKWEDQLLDAFIHYMVENGLPREVYVCDERTRTLLMGLTGQLSLRLTFKQDLPHLERAMEAYNAEDDAAPSNVAPIDSRRAAPRGSYLIAASLSEQCARHILISAGATLFQLHSAILDAFGFDDEHAHAFFMNNRPWSSKDTYYVEDLYDEYDESGRTTSAVTLSQLGLRTRKKFLFLFDFGEEWRFQCEVLKRLKKDTEVPKVEKKIGEAPKQYG